jgi:SNF2 family DNA or RNA helicase
MQHLITLKKIAPIFNGILFPFQQDVLNWTQVTPKGIIGLDMGLGKTVITVAMICAKNYRHVLIVLPLQIVEQWRKSILKFTNLTEKDICVYQGHSRKSANLQSHRIVITTYDVVRYDMADNQSKLFQAVNPKNLFDCMILDEAHKLRNKKTATYASCCQLGHDLECKWLLTGTTIHNKFSDFGNLCGFLGLSHLTTSELRTKYYFRLTKTQCAQFIQLPEKSIHAHELRFEELDCEPTLHHETYLELYAEVKELYEDYLSDTTSVSFTCLLTKVLRLRQCCNHIDATLDEKHYQLENNRHDLLSSPKFDKTIQIINSAPKEDKLIIFSQWEHSLTLLSNHLLVNQIEYLTYNGSQDINVRNQILTQFRDGPARVLLITLTSGGVGLDMSFANHVILLDSWWNQALEEQAIDRVYRIGQKKKVEVHRLYMQDTIEAWMIKMKEEKHKIETVFHDDGQVYFADKNMLSSLLHTYI